MWVVTVMNQKGGVGKTTTTLNLAAALQEHGWRVLVVDFDPQASLTACCGSNDLGRDGSGQTIADAVLTSVHGPVSRPVSLLDVIIHTPSGVDLVPSSQQLASAEASLYTVYGREYALRDTLAVARASYDVIIVDSVPTFGLLAVNGLAAADGLIIPVQAEYLAVYGLAQLLQNVELVRERLNRRLSVWGILLTMVDFRTRHSREVMAAVREISPGRVPVFDTCIPVDVKLKDSTRAGISVLQYDPLARSAQAYRALGAEVGRLLTGKPTLTEVPPTGWGAADQPAARTGADSSSAGSTAPPAVRSVRAASLAARLGLRGGSFELPPETRRRLSEDGTSSVMMPAAQLRQESEPVVPSRGYVLLPDLAAGSLDDGSTSASITPPLPSAAGRYIGGRADQTGDPLSASPEWAGSEEITSDTARQDEHHDTRGVSHPLPPKTAGVERFSRSFKILRRFEWGR